MTRRPFVLPAVAATALLVAACGSSSDTASDATTTSQSTAASTTENATSSPGSESRAEKYILPGIGVFPEGVTADDDTFFVTATGDGAIFRGTLGTPELEVFSPGGSDGRTGAAGIDVSDDDDLNRLVVAGGATGKVWIYDSTTGALVGTFTNGLGEEATFLNDVVIADNGDVFVTDSRNPTLFRIPADQVRSGAPNGSLEPFVNFEGTPFIYGQGFNANGIVEVDDTNALIVAQSSTGNLYRVQRDSKAVTQVDLGGATVLNADGLELDDGTLYVVRNRDGLISRVDLSEDGARGRIGADITDSSFAYPTTVAATEDRLLVVNSQFDKRGESPVEPFTVSSIPQ
ncbi:MAG: superoxide dismutase [Rhodococcus sp. (in: high G+C Gram-positive bacteria)]